MTIAHKLARFCSGLEYPALPADVRQRVPALLADWLANAAAGHVAPWGRALTAVAGSRTAADGAPLAGTLRPADPLTAALVNAGASHATEFDDSDRAGLYHPGAPVISAAWAAAAESCTRVADMMAGIVAGYEMSQRLARAVNPGHYRWWHTTGTVGALGAAAAASRTLGLDPRETLWALGLAGTQASGLWEVLPEAPLAKNLHPAKAAHSGLLAALLASKGIHGPAGILEGERGVFKAMVPQQVRPADCLCRLGEQWLILETTIKAYPVCGHTMTPIEAAFRLRRILAVEDLQQVEIACDPVAIRVAGDPAPETEAQAKFSIPYCVALALVKGEVTLAGFSAAALGDPDVKRVLAMIKLVPNREDTAAPGKRPARLRVRLKNGDRFESVSEFRKGDPENPLTDAEREAKFTQLTVPVWGEAVSRSIWDDLSKIDRFEQIRQWWRRLLQPEIQPREGLWPTRHKKTRKEE